MSWLSWIFISVVLGFLNSVKGNVQGTKSQLQADVHEIKNEELSKFELPHKPKNPVQEVESFKKMTPAERRQLELNFYETFVGICNEEKIADCEHKDVKFLAGLLAKGDSDCIMTCSKYQMLQNLDNLPNGVKTVKFIQAIGVFLNDLDISKKRDKNKLTEMNRKGCAAVGGSECAEKRLIGFFTAIVLFTVAKVGLLAAQSHIAATSDSEFTQSVSSGASVVRAVGRSGGCFSAESLVNLKMKTGSVVSKPLHSISLGDMVESVDEQTGQRVYSKVYYIEHEQQDARAQLLRIVYRDHSNATHSIGISARHLIYATKNGQSTKNAPLKVPIMAMDVKEDDTIWIMNNGKLVPTKVTDVMTYFGAVRHPLTENHHVIVDGVHASVHILNEQLYRKLSYPLQLTYWANSEWNRSWLVKKLVRLVQNGKEPFFTSSPTELLEYWTGSALPGILSSPISH